MACSLRPLEWFNLASIHGPIKHLLLDDFYDQDGVAYQPATEVEVPEQFPAPALTEVRESPEAIVGFAMTRWSLKDDLSARDVQPDTSSHRFLPSIQSSSQSASDGLWGWMMDSIGTSGSLSPIPMK